MSGSIKSNPWLTRLPVLVAAHLVGTVNVVSVLAMAPVISTELNLTATQFGLFCNCILHGPGSRLPAGRGMTDRFGIGRSLFIGHILMALSAVMLSYADGYHECLAALFSWASATP